MNTTPADSVPDLTPVGLLFDLGEVDQDSQAASRRQQAARGRAATDS